MLAFCEGFTVSRMSVERRTTHSLPNIARPSWVKPESSKYRPLRARDWCERNILMFFGGRVAENLFLGREPSTEVEGDECDAVAFASPYVGGPRAATAWLNWLHVRAEEIISLRRGAVLELADELIEKGDFDLRWGRHRVEQAVRYDIAMAEASARVARERSAGVVPIRAPDEQ